MSSTALSDESARTVAEKVVDAISDAEGEAATELTPPLYDAIDPEALDAVTESMNSEGTIAFEYCGHEVRVDGDGEISIDG
ncbi:HalOD1 output domain-containing protein [Natronoarchaeum mannanilyticum]|uniref:Halobacterial output domain-containing protein n=1 Tax=Natronoarchaeum mannanilyticum TaxID=926360 RepID=A0AAV3T7I5_9EURY